MTKSALKGVKSIAKFAILALTFTTACIPQAFEGLPVPIGQTPAPNTRADLCNLLLSVGGTSADVQTCLTATSISDADKARLCALSSGLTADQKNTLRSGLTNLGVDVNTCDALGGTVAASPTSGTVSGPTVAPTSGTSTGTTAAPTSVPTSGPTSAPTATATATSSPTASPTSGGGGGGGGGGGSTGCDSCSSGSSGTTTVTVTKVSNGDVGSFTFTGNNGYTTTNITTTESGSGVAGTTRTLGADNTATTITETAKAGYAVTDISCTGLGSEGTATPNLSTRSVLLNSVATAPHSSIACTFTNAKLPTVTITKVSNGGIGTFSFTGDNGYTTTNITTTESGAGVAGTTRTLTAASTATTITESTPPVGFTLTAISCTGIGEGTATPNFSARSVTLNETATAPGSNIACTFTNSAANPNDVNVGVTVSNSPIPRRKKKKNTKRRENEKAK